MKVAAGVLAVLAIVMAVVPSVANCSQAGEGVTLANGRRAPAPCHGTAQAEVAVAALLMAVAGLLACSWRQETRLALAGLGSILGALAILLPVILIGTCPSSAALCNRLMRPALIASGAGTILTSVLVFALAARRSEYAQRPRNARGRVRYLRRNG